MNEKSRWMEPLFALFLQPDGLSENSCAPGARGAHRPRDKGGIMLIEHAQPESPRPHLLEITIEANRTHCSQSKRSKRHSMHHRDRKCTVSVFSNLKKRSHPFLQIG